MGDRAEPHAARNLGQSDCEFAAAVAYAFSQPNPLAVWASARLDRPFYAAVREAVARLHGGAP